MESSKNLKAEMTDDELLEAAKIKSLVAAPTRLVDTEDFTKLKPLQYVNENGTATEEYAEIPFIGDGNCGAYVLAGVVLDLIYRNQLTLTDEQFHILWEKIKDSANGDEAYLIKRLASYENKEENYNDLAEHLREIVRYIQDHIKAKTNPTFADFKKLILDQNSREKFAALVVALGPAVRQIAVDADSARVNGHKRNLALNDMRMDTVHLDDEVLYQGARGFFKINLTVYQNDGHSKNLVLLPTGEPIPDAPRGYIVRKPAHFNMLINIYERRGLANLPADPRFAAQVQAILEQNYTQIKNKLLQDARENRITFSNDAWLKLKAQAEQHGCTAEEQANASIRKNRNYLFSQGVPEVAVTEALQIKLDEELAKKIQLEELGVRPRSNSN